MCQSQTVDCSQQAKNQCYIFKEVQRQEQKWKKRKREKEKQEVEEQEKRGGA